jgi:hypothetical protein
LDPSSKTNAKQEYSAGRPGSDKLAELERRYIRKDSPSPESAGALKIGIEADGKRFSFRPRSLRRFVPWIIAGLSFCGVTGASITGYFVALNSGRARIIAVETKERERDDEIAQIKARLDSQTRRIKTLEAGTGAALVVTK